MESQGRMPFLISMDRCWEWRGRQADEGMDTSATIILSILAAPEELHPLGEWTCTLS